MMPGIVNHINRGPLIPEGSTDEELATSLLGKMYLAYDLSETSGAYNDSHAPFFHLNAFSGTVNRGQPALFAGGPLCASFPNVSSAVRSAAEIPALRGQVDLSFESWVIFDVDGNANQTICTYDAGGSGPSGNIQFQLDLGTQGAATEFRIRFQYGNQTANNVIFSPTAIPIGDPFHIGWKRNATTNLYTLYLAGLPVDEIAPTQSNPPSGSSSAQRLILGNNFANTQGMRGRMSCARFYNALLTDEEMLWLSVGRRYSDIVTLAGL